MSESDESPLRVEALLSLLGLILLGYVGGAYSQTFRVFPYPQLLESYFGTVGSVARRGLARPGTPQAPAAWQPTWYEEFGVVGDLAGPSGSAYTLYSSAGAPEAHLVNAAGERLHSWKAPFSKVWPEAPHVGDLESPTDFYWRRVHLLPNGDLLALYTAAGGAPQGAGLVRLNRRSEVVWSHAAKTHHDFAVRRDGSIYALAHRFRSPTPTRVGAMEDPPDEILADSVVQLAPDGEEVARVSVLEAFSRSNYRSIIEGQPSAVEAPGEKAWDVLHTSSIAIIGPEFARRHPFAEAGQLLLTCRTVDIVAILDIEQERIVWASRGYWWQPTDAEPLDDGSLMVFDSNGHGGAGLPSRVLKFDPSSERVTWRYSGDREHPFWSREGGSLEVLSSGNLLVTSTLSGRIFEVTPAGEIDWEFRNPARRTVDGRPVVAATWDGQRISAELVRRTELGASAR